MEDGAYFKQETPFLIIEFLVPLTLAQVGVWRLN
jgi:hypothetical protein